MKRRTWIRLLAAALLVVGVAAASPAGADEGPPPVTWGHGDVCAVGALNGGWSAEGQQFSLWGWAERCPGAPEPDRFPMLSLVRYHTLENTVEGHGLAPFQAVGHTGIALSFSAAALESPVSGTVRAMCLAVSPGHRLGCVGLGVDANGVGHVTPVPLDDPLVTGPVRVLPTSGGLPLCGACV